MKDETTSLKLNMLPVRLTRPSCILPFLPLPKDRKPKEIFTEIYEPEAAARIVWNVRESQIVFIKGIAPEGYSCGKQIYEWTNARNLPKAIIEYAVADYLAQRCEIVWQWIDKRQWGCCAFRPVEGLHFEHIAFEEGIYFRADSSEKAGEYTLVINWRARTLFTKTLENREMRSIANGASVMLAHLEVPDELSRYAGRYCGRVKQISGDNVSVSLPNGETTDIPSSWLKLEPKPENFTTFDRSFPKLAPLVGVTTTRLQLDKTLVGHSRNQRLYKERLAAALEFLFSSGVDTLNLTPAVGQGLEIQIDAAPIRPGTVEGTYPCAFSLPQPEFLYKGDVKHENRKKTDGMVKIGPHGMPPIGKPTYGFLFANRHRPEARKLFAALRDGVGYFRGIQPWFGLPLKNDSVVSVSDFDVAIGSSEADAAQSYANALDAWLKGSHFKPDIFFVVHDRTEQEEETSPYYACKALLLRHGIMAQNVTVDLIDNPSQFQWAASNIALGAFTKLGGTPWTLEPSSTRKSLIIGIGRAERHDPVSRARHKYQAFATCSSSDGRFGFVSVYPEVGEEDLAESLGNAVSAALRQAETLKLPYDSLVIHLTGDLKREEKKAVESAAESFKPNGHTSVCIISVSEDHEIFAISDENPNGTPGRGQVVRLRDDDFLVLTEGIEDLAAARFRSPCSVRVHTRALAKGIDPIPLVAQVYDLSHVNFRAFNGASKPISVLYSTLIAKSLRFQGIADAIAAKPELNNRMWFL